jgi:predicted GNAT family acetyltransferase
MTDFKIDNNAPASRFELPYVEVPVTVQGHGIAGKLSHAALEFARDNGLKVVLRCPFIATYMRRHAELLQPVR